MYLHHPTCFVSQTAEGHLYLYFTVLVKNCRNYYIYSNNLRSEILRLEYSDIFLDFFISTHGAE